MLQVHTPDEVRHAALRDPEIPAYIHRAMAGYALHYYYFEVFEMMRKLALVGVAVVFEPGSMEQASYGLLVCFFCVVVYSSCSPYVDRGEDILAQLCQFMIFVVLVSAIVLRADRTEATSSRLDLVLLVLTISPMVLAVYLELGCTSLAKRLFSRATGTLYRGNNVDEEPCQYRPVTV